MPPRCAGSWSVLAFGCDAKLGFRRCTKGEALPLGFRADILADETVFLEIKGVLTLLPLRDMQLQTDLRMSGVPIGLLFNFHVLRLKDGLRRFVG
jgi:GxxExxY protein